MSTFKIELPEELTAFVDRQAQAQGFASSSDYIAAVISRQRDLEALRVKLIAGADSGPGKPIDESWFTSLRLRANQ